MKALLLSRSISKNEADLILSLTGIGLFAGFFLIWKSVEIFLFGETTSEGSDGDGADCADGGGDGGGD